MKIGIDIDGVLTDYERYMLDYGSKYFKKRIEDPNGPEIIDIFNVTEKEEHEFWMNHFLDYITNEKPRVFASEIINKLKETNEIHIITARELKGTNDPDGSLMKSTVKRWLKNENIPYDYIEFTKEKLNYIVKNNIDIMIEDNPKNALTISSQIPVILMNTSYNKKVNGKNITRAYSWYDIYKIIKEKGETYERNSINRR